MKVQMKRVYNDAQDDGIRILVDRVWPRGISKEKAALDYWEKQVGLTTELRKWFNHNPDKFEDFKKKYKQELQSGSQKDALDTIKHIMKESNQDITLIYAAKDETYNHVVILKEILNKSI